MLTDIGVKDSAVERLLDAVGYAVLPPVKGDVLAHYLDETALTMSRVGPQKPNYNSGFDVGNELRDQTFDRLCNDFVPELYKHLEEVEIVFGAVFIKRRFSGTDGRLRVHCDPSLLPDESRQRHLNCWIPLVDVDETNGMLWVVPGSHRAVAPVHAFSIPSPFGEITKTVMAHGHPVPLRRGDVLLFDNRLLHYSLENRSAADRPAIILSMVPRASKLVSFYRSGRPDWLVEVYTRPRGRTHLAAFQHTIERPTDGTFLGYLDFQPEHLTAGEFMARVTSKQFKAPYSFRIIPR